MNQERLHQERLQRIRNGKLLEVIREKPAMYLGERSLSALQHFLAGYGYALFVHDVPHEFQLPRDFHDWVAYRLHFFESTSGYRNMILKHVRDEAAALDRFFELLDKHRKRQPHIVATVQGHRREYTIATKMDGAVTHKPGLLPETLTLVTYTDDPGFFVSCPDPTIGFPEKDRFIATLRSFELFSGVSKENLTILDATTYNRWLIEEDRFKNPTDTEVRPLNKSY
jgi:hypothetical protein